MGLTDRDRIESMILVGSGTDFLPHCRASMEGASADGYPPEWWEIMRDRHAYGDEQIRTMAGYLPQLAAADGDVAFTTELLGSLEARTFIVHGDSDWCFPSSMAARMHEAIPESELWIIPQGDHVPILGEWAPEFLRLALEFLEDREG
jgi:pimeloyl-ACP methyl ester carboxylesterase